MSEMEEGNKRTDWAWRERRMARHVRGRYPEIIDVEYNWDGSVTWSRSKSGDKTNE